MSVIALNELKTVNEIKAHAAEILKYGFLPDAFKTTEQVMVAVQYGREIGLDFMTAINNINVIGGKPTLSIHAIASLIRKAGIRYRLVEDAVWIREDGTIDPIRLTTRTTKDGKTVTNYSYNYIDCRTTFEFVEMFQGQPLVQSFSFLYSEAKSQELDQKSNWKKMFKIMMRTRALSLGARLVCPEALLGMYEITEMLDAKRIDYDIKQSDDGFAEATITNIN